MARRNIILVSRTLYQVGIITLASSILWTAIGIYLTLNKATTADVEKSLLEPIVANINQEVVVALSNRLKLEELLPISLEATMSAKENVTIEESVTK